MSDCGVCLSSDLPNVRFFFERSHIARTPHKCSECAGAILPGVTYIEVGGICEGDWWRQTLCLICNEITKVFHCGGTVMYGNLWNDMDEAVFPELTMNNPCIHKLSNEARAFLTARWWDWKERTA